MLPWVGVDWAQQRCAPTGAARQAKESRYDRLGVSTSVRRFGITTTLENTLMPARSLSRRAVKGALRLARYADALGPVCGARALAQVVAGKGCVEIGLPGGQLPVAARTDKTDVKIFEQVFIDRQYDMALPLSRPRLIIDAGANVGYASVFFANKYPGARILAVEPEASNFALLVRNTRPYENVTPIQAALWSRSVPLEIENPEGGHWAFRMQEAPSGRAGTLPAVTVPQLMARAEAEAVDLLKLDIEGGEKTLFTGGRVPWLRKVNALLIELHDEIQPGCAQAFYRALRGYHFSQFTRGETLAVIRHGGEAP